MAALPPYAGVSRIRFDGSEAAGSHESSTFVGTHASLSTALSGPPGSGEA
jgi:hypothetical protein